MDVQGELKSRSENLATQIDKLTTDLAAIPDVEQTKHAAMVARLVLLQEHQGKDWRTLPYDDIRRFLHYLFGDNPRKLGYGIFVTKDAKGCVTATFKGCFDFYHIVSNGRPVSEAFVKEAERLNVEISRVFHKGLKKADAEYRKAPEPLYAN